MKTSTNVEFYLSGFDKSGKRVGSLICNFDPTKQKNVDKLEKLKEEAKSKFPDAEIVEVTDADAYDKYVSGDFVRGADGQPVPYVPPEPTEAEKKAAAVAGIKAKYQPQLDSLVEARVKAAMLGANTSKIDGQYKATLASMASEIKSA